MDVISYLKTQYDWEEGTNYFRFAGTVDVFKKGKIKRKPKCVARIVVIPERMVYYPKTILEQLDIVINHIEFYQDLRQKKYNMEQKPRFTYHFETGGRNAGKTLKASTRVTAGGLKDDSLMPFGQHKGEKIINVPASYLLWLFDNDKCNSEIREYCRVNEDVLRFQAKQKR